MAHIRRCDSCRREENLPPVMFLLASDNMDSWWHVQNGLDTRLQFCQASCVGDYFTAKKMLEDMGEPGHVD